MLLVGTVRWARCTTCVHQTGPQWHSNGATTKQMSMMTTTTTNNNSRQLSEASKWQPLRLAAVAAVGVAATEANRSSRNSLHPTPAARAS